VAARLPKKIDFGIAVVHITQVGVGEMRDIADCEQDEPTPDGCWDAQSDSIYLLKKLSLKRKREVLFHELVHAAVDNQYWSKHI
jgi:Zn-dependent peptidase ImmA (M78 family)